MKIFPSTHFTAAAKDYAGFFGVPDFSRARVLVVGDVMLDRYWHGPTSRISPEAPVPVVHVQEDESRLGGAGNVALNAAVLGAKTHIIGLSGDDEQADKIESLLNAGGVQCLLQRVAGSKTITKLRILSRNQQLIRADFEDHFPDWDCDALQTTFKQYLHDADAVVLSDYAKGVLRRSAELIAAARQAGKIVVVDPKGTDFERYRGATVITPNLSEFEAVVGRCSNDADLQRKGEALRSALDLEAVLVTRSDKGMTLLARDHAPLHLPTRAQEVFDVTGAGDTVVATLSAALGAGVPMAEAVALSNVAAGIVVAKIGTATVRPAELRRATYSASEPASGSLFEAEEILSQIADARSCGERIVLIRGSFDRLGPSQVECLENMRRLEGKLVVAVNNCKAAASVEIKPAPFNSLSARMRMIAALSCVDWVVPLEADELERLTSIIAPDIFVEAEELNLEMTETN